MLMSESMQPQDAIDFTDNDIQLLGNFPLSPRLQSLLLARNRVSSIQSTLAQSLPNLTTLVLTGNNFKELADLDVLGSFPKLTTLVLLENPVVRKEVRSSPVYCLCEYDANGLDSTTGSTSSGAALHSASSILRRCV